jgi:hypothetical protein
MEAVQIGVAAGLLLSAVTGFSCRAARFISSLRLWNNPAHLAVVMSLRHLNLKLHHYCPGGQFKIPQLQGAQNVAGGHDSGLPGGASSLRSTDHTTNRSLFTAPTTARRC